MNQKKNNTFLFASIIAIICLIVFVSFDHVFLAPAHNPSATVSPTREQNNLTYKGKASIDALTLLKQKGSIVQDSSGLVTTINNRKADPSKHEYWAFFINGKMAEVGPGNYQTKDTDIIDWKIATY